MALQKGKLGVTKFHDQNLKAPYVKDAHGGTARGQGAGRGCHSCRKDPWGNWVAGLL